MRSLSVLLMLATLTACSSQPPENSNRFGGAIGKLDLNRPTKCGTATLGSLTGWTYHIQDQKVALVWFTGNRARQFTDFYTKIVPGPIDLVPDVVVVFDYRGAHEVFAMLFRHGCLITSSTMESALFGEIKDTLGMGKRKTLILIPPGFNI